MGLVGIDVVPARSDDALSVDQHDPLPPDTQPHIVLRGSDGGGPGAHENDPHVLGGAPGDLERVEQRGAGDDRGAVLVVVKDRDRQRLGQPALDLEALGRLDVLEVDPADSGLQHRAEPDHVVRLRRVDFQVEHIDVGEDLEEDAFALHDRLACERPDISQSQYRGAVADDGDQISLGSVAVGILGPIGNAQTGFGHAGSVGQREIALVAGRLGRDDLNFPGAAFLVIPEGVLAAIGRRRHRGASCTVGCTCESASTVSRSAAPGADTWGNPYITSVALGE